MSELKDKAKIVAEFLKEMEEKYPKDKNSKIAIVYDTILSEDKKNIPHVIVYEITGIDWEPDFWQELERIEVK